MKIDAGGQVENVYIYVSDALRYDSVPERLREYGSVLKTVSSGTNTCTEFPTMVTGLYPPQHGVWTFSGLIDSSTETIFDFADGEFPNYWTPSPIVDSRDDVIHYNDLFEYFQHVERLDQPFVLLDRDNLPHLPYGYDNASGLDKVTEEFGYDMSPVFTAEGENPSSKEYQAQRDGDFEQMRQDYRVAAEGSVRRFESRLGVLRDLGLLENTLVIFTADHGEELGEYGQFMHGGSPVPETVYVPTLFYRDDRDITVDADFMAHVDLFPTIASAMDVSASDELPGYDLLDGAPERRQIFSAIQSNYLTTNCIEYGSWGPDGGHIFSEIDTFDALTQSMRLSVRRHILGAYPLRNAWRTGKATFLGERSRRRLSFGEPHFDHSRAEEFCDTVLDESVSATKQELDEDVKKRLEDLGYREESIE